MKLLVSFLALGVLAHSEEKPKRACLVAGTVLSVKPDTRAAAGDRQFRLRVAETPWPWMIGTDTPVTSTSRHGLKVGDAVTVAVDCKDHTRRGRLYGEVVR